jgi:hypothetical protein
MLRLYAAAGLALDAVDWCREAAEHLSPPARERLRCQLALTLRRAGHLEAAVRVWQEQADEPGMWGARAQVELAKYYEHQRRDYETAIRAAEAALIATSIWDQSQSRLAVLELERRLSRLRARARRRRAGTAAGATMV